MSVTYSDLTFTTFPENIDTFVTMLDIVANDAAALNAYQTAMESGNITQANNALTNLENADKKILTAAKINKLSDAITALQRFFVSDIQPYISGLQTNWQAEIDKFSYIGTYSSTSSYKKNNIVNYTVGALNLLYICLKDAVAGIAPTNTTYWKQFTIQGTRGPSGEDLAYSYEWDNTTSYAYQDCVTHNGKLWNCVVANSNVEPTESATQWKLIMALNSAIYPVQSSQPTLQEVGELWFQTV